MELSNGVSIPAIGLGVYKMQAGSEMNAAVKAAYRAGYRLFDTAQMYGNEAALGEALRDAGIPREDVFLISKINNDSQWYTPALASIRETLRKMQTPYLDSFLIHWPGQNRSAHWIPGARWKPHTAKGWCAASAYRILKYRTSSICWITVKSRR